MHIFEMNILKNSKVEKVRHAWRLKITILKIIHSLAMHVWTNNMGNVYSHMLANYLAML